MAKVDVAVDGDSLSSSAPPNHGINTTTTQGPVEARSLSSITSIASNPPAYPRNPAQKKLDSLELYIVRVPGSKGERFRKFAPPPAPQSTLPELPAAFSTLGMMGWIANASFRHVLQMYSSLLSSPRPKTVFPRRPSTHRFTTCMSRHQRTIPYSKRWKKSEKKKSNYTRNFLAMNSSPVRRSRSLRD